MSKLLAKLERINRVVTGPLGFSTAARVDKTPAMALIGLLSQNYAQGAARLVRLDADGALLEGADLGDKLADLAEALDKVPWGLRVKELKGEETQQLLALGCDFFAVRPEGTLVEALKDDRGAYLLCLPPDADEGFLRAIEGLPVDAVLMTPNSLESPLTLQHLVYLSSVRAMFDKYLMVEVPVTLSTKEVEGLRDIGVDAIVVDAGRTSLSALEELKEKLLNLPRQRRGRSERVNAILPHGSRSSTESPPDEEEEEDP